MKPIDNESHKVYLGLGSNLGNRKAILNEAISLIQKRVGEVVRQSSFLETEPWGFTSHNKFLNACICVNTQYSPRQILKTTQAIEKDMGRCHKTVNHQYHDRIIDIDILMIDDLNIDDSDLKVPHPLMKERDFVMIPLKEIM
ncbi:2-amino-4-hydroxy-6-hydroxymethyldihydropteridine diphosphokinase [Prevotella pallens]|uniref:2-amino-4-hydroxy-6- hydroxymethyldihydropteridine diphosphokinase n=1 Tax=Prevotella pallens TaxID=60133 RepID=UPI001CB3C729|nr:2-amino-4-hydroxy-6-hydroxymethyldihydropteridine diphosphokinase [Prevotella pallens]MBF1450225.1 2-amino-4-hydroxy-6-hydroxymethyldihydropteridine diphosphokinase [Prevotella pallens]MBF1467062.1 2-amino-4-hydroxy-6-hydroxymethyldihydropteridine diphosphokinase [Prevotella pallens]MBF1467851.1 2-amino-4-hydroxy-6-hydroxymethyldihydropteridine diphosphokinase [Prevotella pallens]MBF1473735.1 2-amino-4-hydroxy-6-hydroxymethyldihydropteridine diphosphokinase [Prevotella pallens]MBF1479112.1 